MIFLFLTFESFWSTYSIELQAPIALCNGEQVSAFRFQQIVNKLAKGWKFASFNDVTLEVLLSWNNISAF